MTDMLTKQRTSLLGATVCLLSCALAAGCGSNRTLGRVSGRVTLDGRPCGGVIVVFGCVEQRAFIKADVGEDGTYAAQMAEGHGLPVGTYEVSIRPAPPTDWSRPPRVVPIPQRYRDPKTSGLSLTVEEGENRFDVAMTTNPAGQVEVVRHWKDSKEEKYVTDARAGRRATPSLDYQSFPADARPIRRDRDARGGRQVRRRSR